MGTKGLHHVAICVHDVAAAIPFYRDVLGLAVTERPDLGFPGAWFVVGSSQIHLMQLPDHVRPGPQHFALEVEDLEATCREIEARGVEVHRGNARLRGLGRQAFLKDPSGNSIELNQPDSG